MSARETIYAASMQGRPIWVSQLRSCSPDPASLAANYRLAESLGVQIKGQFSYQEWKSILAAIGPTR